MSTRSDPERDIEIMRYGWGSKLDPLLVEGAPAYNSRAIVDACRPFERRADFPKVAQSDPDYLRSVRQRWEHQLRP
jgi:3-polyprenyl-4-hydroxybenzoate decarboxylase